jgi:hypothetical protein
MTIALRSGSDMESVAKKLTTCQLDESGHWLRLNFDTEDGAPSALVLPIDCARALLMTLPGMIDRALKTRYRDASMRLVYPMGDWAIETDAKSAQRILTLATPEGFKVAFALTPESAGHLATSLGKAADVPFSETVN